VMLRRNSVPSQCNVVTNCRPLAFATDKSVSSFLNEMMFTVHAR